MSDFDGHHTPEQARAAFARAHDILVDLRAHGVELPRFELFVDGSGRLVLGRRGDVTLVQYQHATELVFSQRMDFDADEIAIRFCCGLVRHEPQPDEAELDAMSMEDDPDPLEQLLVTVDDDGTVTDADGNVVAPYDPTDVPLAGGTVDIVEDGADEAAQHPLDTLITATYNKGWNNALAALAKRVYPEGRPDVRQPHEFELFDAIDRLKVTS